MRSQVSPVAEQIAVSVEEAARLYGIGKTTAWVLVMNGTWPSIKLGKCRRVPVKALERWAEAQCASDDPVSEPPTDPSTAERRSRRAAA